MTMYDKRIAFKILFYLTIILTISFLSKGQVSNDEENVDIPYHGMHNDMTMTADTEKSNNYIFKRQTENEVDGKGSNEQLVSESNLSMESEENPTNNESAVENEENIDGKKITISESDEYQNNGFESNDIENQDQLENSEEPEKTEESTKNAAENTINRAKRVNKAGSSHKNRPSLNRVTGNKNKVTMSKLLPVAFFVLIMLQFSYFNVITADQNDLSNLRHLLYAPYNDKLRIGDSFDNMDYHSLLNFNQLSKMKVPYTRNIKSLLNSPHLLITTKRFNYPFNNENKDETSINSFMK